jgi:hypothetical protein
MVGTKECGYPQVTLTGVETMLRNAVRAALLLPLLACVSEPPASPPILERPPAGFASVIQVSNGFTNRLGVNTHSYPVWTGESVLMDSLASANIGWARMPEFWGQPNVRAQTIGVAQLASARGMHVLGGVAVGVGHDVPNAAWRATNCPHLVAPQHLDKWNAYVDSMVTEQGAAGIRYFAIGNEVNSISGCSNWRTYYWPMLTRAAAIVHSKGSDYKVVGFGLGSGFSDWDTIDDLMDQVDQTDSIVDVLGIHIYNSVNEIMSTMNGAVAAEITHVPEVWLTEFGPAGAVTDLQGRDHLATFLQNWLTPGFVTNPKWTKSFIYSLASSAEGTTKLFDCTGSPSVPCFPEYAFYATRYLQQRAWSGISGVTYQAFAHNTQAWYNGADGSWAPTELYEPEGVWGTQIAIAPDLARAGVQLCVKYHYGMIGWHPNPFCSGETVGPHYWWHPTWPLQLEAFSLATVRPLPQANGSPMQLCASTMMKSLVLVDGYDTPQGCAAGDSIYTHTIGSTGMSRPVLSYRVYFSGTGW